MDGVQTFTDLINDQYPQLFDTPPIVGGMSSSIAFLSYIIIIRTFFLYPLPHTITYLSIPISSSFVSRPTLHECSAFSNDDPTIDAPPTTDPPPSPFIYHILHHIHMNIHMVLLLCSHMFCPPPSYDAHPPACTIVPQATTVMPLRTSLLLFNSSDEETKQGGGG